MILNQLYDYLDQKDKNWDYRDCMTDILDYIDNELQEEAKELNK